MKNNPKIKNIFNLFVYNLLTSRPFLRTALHEKSHRYRKSVIFQYLWKKQFEIFQRKLCIQAAYLHSNFIVLDPLHHLNGKIKRKKLMLH